jgi:hypothetical protein
MSSSVFFNGRREPGRSPGVTPTAWAERVSVVFAGFHTAGEAYRMAVSSYAALRKWLVRQRRTGPLRGSGQVLRTRHDGRRWHLALQGVSVGGIVEPGDARAGGVGGYGFELLLPPGLGPHAADRALRVVASAIERHASVQDLTPVGADRDSRGTSPATARGGARPTQ